MAKTNNPVVSALAAYPGKYQKKLFSLMFNSLDVASDITLMKNVKNKLGMTSLTVNDTARPYSGDYKPQNNDLVYKDRFLEVSRAQRDIEIDPEKYRTTYLSEELSEGSSSDKKDVPFAQYTWEKIVGEVAASLNDRTAWNGVGVDAFVVFDAGDTYAAGELVYFNDGNRVNYYRANAPTTAGQSPSTHPAKWDNYNPEAIAKGLGTIFLEEIDNATIDPVVTGAITSSSGAYAQFMELWRSQTAPIRSKGAIIYCSYTDFDLLVDDYEDTVGKFTSSETGIHFLPKSDKKCIVKPCTWMSSTRRLVCAPKTHLAMGTDRLSDIEKITTVPSHYTLEASLSFLIGFQIGNLGEIRISDQA
jgi:hypothetical protein